MPLNKHVHTWCDSQRVRVLVRARVRVRVLVRVRVRVWVWWVRVWGAGLVRGAVSLLGALPWRAVLPNGYASLSCPPRSGRSLPPRGSCPCLAQVSAALQLRCCSFCKPSALTVAALEVAAAAAAAEEEEEEEEEKVE